MRGGRGIRRHAWVVVAMAVALPCAVAYAEELDSGYGMPATAEEVAGAAQLDGILDADVAAIGGEGATVRNEICTVNQPTIFTQALRARGQLVDTPSGSQHLVCHVQPPPRLFVAQPAEAIVVRDFTCSVGNRRTRESQLVVTPSLHVHVVCHITPAG